MNVCVFLIAIKDNIGYEQHIFDDSTAIEKANGYKAWYLNSEFITYDPLIWMVMQYENN